MKQTGRKALTWLMTLAMLMSLVPGMAVPAWAADEAQAPEAAMWSPTDIEIRGVEGQEYVIAPKGSEPDWSQAVEPEDGFVDFEGLTPATAYVIYTRIKDDPGEPKTTELTTSLSGLGVFSADDYVPGAVFTVEPDPADTQGLTYQWYYDVITPEGDGERHEFIPIDGATETTYTIQEADLGKYLAVKAFRDQEEVGDVSSLGPVTDESSAPAEGEAAAPEPVMWTPTDIGISGVEGQEYVIAPKGTEPDWSQAVEPEDGFVDFEGLTPATAYVIYTRIKDDPGEPKTTELTTSLSGLGVFSADDYVPGAVFTVEPDPADTQGLTYQWYYDVITPEGDGERHEFIPIDGATETTYTIQEADLGKYLAVKAFRDQEEVGDVSSLGPVTDGSSPAEDETCPKDDTCPISPFTDSQPDAWYHDGVHWALQWGLMNGVADDKFDPSGTATRAMVVTMLWRLEGEPESDPSSFADVPADSWYAHPVGWAAENGVVEGISDTSFAPDASVTREQLATILYRYAQKNGLGFTGTWAFLLDFPDREEVSDWAYEAMCWMTMNGIIQGTDGGNLAPKDNANRAQIATMFQRFYAVLEEGVPQNQQDDLYLVLVNKTHKLPDNWESKIELLEMKNAYDQDIRVEKGSYEAFVALRDALLEDGVDIELDSCYRSVARQEELWAEFERDYGLEYTQKYVAVPGFSEHHTGFAVDVCLIKDGELIYDNDEMMKETAIWEKVHEKMPEFGFILRYPEGKEAITGYSYEPWHMRYVADPAIAQEITDKGITFEEYLGQVEPANAIVDYGSSDLFTREEMTAAIDLIREQLDQWEGCELHKVLYAGDDSNSADNIQWMNELKEGQDYTQCIEFLTNFHSPAENTSTLDPDKEYTDYQWWLARTEGGDWELLSWGY